MAAHVLNLELQLLLCALLGSLCQHVSRPLPSAAIGTCPYLESKVLQEVCRSIGLFCLGAAASIDPDTDGGGLSPRGVLGSDLRRLVNCSPDSSYVLWHTVKPFLRVVDSVLDP
jgi:hypothetical protein